MAFFLGSPQHKVEAIHGSCSKALCSSAAGLKWTWQSLSQLSSTLINLLGKRSREFSRKGKSCFGPRTNWHIPYEDSKKGPKLQVY